MTTTSILPDTLDQNAKGDSIVINLAARDWRPIKPFCSRSISIRKVRPPSPFADYRQVFFLINPPDIDDTTGNATTSATFTVPGGSQSFTLPDTAWANQQDVRHTNYYGTTVAAHYMDDFVTQWGTGGISTVPEPSTMVLAGLGAFGAILGGWRARRNKNAA